MLRKIFVSEPLRVRHFHESINNPAVVEGLEARIMMIGELTIVA
jgi:hypothetical protein